LTNADNYVIMAFMIKRQENKRVKNTLEKSQNYSRIPLTNDDKYYIMANMTNNINTLTKKGITNMDFDNGIFRTVADETRKGIVWVVRVANGEKITFCRTQADVDFCIAELMTQRLAR